MYLNHFKMKKAPFNVTPDPEFLYLSPSHKEALAAVIYGVKQKKGFVAIIGEVGVGKTTIIRSYLNMADRESLRLIYLFNANITFVGLLKSVLRELGLVTSSESPVDMVTKLHEYLINEYAKGRTVVLIIDEAQNMPVETLENLRMLSNLETTKDKLIQIIFSAQPEFEELLARKELRQLKQRIAVKATIQPLSSDESLNYIRHRLAKASASDNAIFNASAIRLIVKQAKGIPRVINMLCDNSLITSYGNRQKSVSRRTVSEIIADSGINGGRAFRTSHAVVIVLLGISLIAGIYVASDLGALRLTSAIGASSVDHVGVMPPAPAAGQKRFQAEESVPAAATADVKPTSVSRLVKKGDTMAALVMDTYGHVDKSHFELVKKNNPGIRDVNRIAVGERIVFPVTDR